MPAESSQMTETQVARLNKAAEEAEGKPYLQYMAIMALAVLENNMEDRQQAAAAAATEPERHDPSPAETPDSDGPVPTELNRDGAEETEEPQREVPQEPQAVVSIVVHFADGTTKTLDPSVAAALGL